MRGRRIVLQRHKDVQQPDEHEPIWTVASSNRAEAIYSVNWLTQTCSCPDFKKHEDRCKHLWAIHFARLMGGGLSMKARLMIGWYKTNLSTLAGHQYRSTTPAKCLTHVERWLLEGAFIDIERRIEALHRIGNHHARQLTRWLGKWSARINSELSRRPKLRTIYTEIL